MPSAPSAFPLLGAPGNEPNPPRKGVKAWGEGPLRPKEIIQLPRRTWPDLCRSKHSRRSATRQLNRCSITILLPESIISHSNIVLEESMMQVSFGLTTYIYIYIYIMSCALTIHLKSKTFTYILFNYCPVGWEWGCRIHRLHLCRGVRHPSNECPGYDTKKSVGDVPVMLGLWGMQSTPSLPSLPGPLWPSIVAPDRALSLG